MNSFTEPNNTYYFKPSNVAQIKLEKINYFAAKGISCFYEPALPKDWSNFNSSAKENFLSINSLFYQREN